MYTYFYFLFNLFDSSQLSVVDGIYDQSSSVIQKIILVILFLFFSFYLDKCFRFFENSWDAVYDRLFKKQIEEDEEEEEGYAYDENEEQYFKNLEETHLTNSSSLSSDSSVPESPIQQDYDPSFSNLPPGFDDINFEIVENVSTTFSDVAGNEEAKEELKEVVDFLTDPNNFLKLGAAIPKGVLLSGPPGTGKTLLAKAVAGEAKTTFLKVSGSQFVELLAGLGAERVRKLFETARGLTPCIIFIDEIDSIARTRSFNASVGGANDERDQTLNQLLTEMDGFKVDTSIVIIAATNRLDILDPAILRPGRFDRQIGISNPNLKEREEILKVHLRGKKLDKGVSLAQIAQRTIGFSGADLANLLNEAAILATRRNKKSITVYEIAASIDRIIAGLEGRPISRMKVKQLLAFHEIGQAFVGSLIETTNSIEKISLLPRGTKTSASWMIPSQSFYNSRYIFLKQIIISLTGRATEEMIGGRAEITSGDEEEILLVTRSIRTIIIRYAMAKLQQLKQEAQQRNLYVIGSDVKEELTNLLDDFVTNFINSTYGEIVSFLEISRPITEKISDNLITSEEITGNDLKSTMYEYYRFSNDNDYISNNVSSNLFDIIFVQLTKAIKKIHFRKFLKKTKLNQEKFKEKLQKVKLVQKNKKILDRLVFNRK